MIVSDVWPGGPAEAAGLQGRRHPALGGRAARRQPADGQLQLPPERFDGERATGRAQGRNRSRRSASRRSNSGANSIPSPRWPTPRRTWCPSSASSAWKSMPASPRARPGSERPYGIIVVARAAGATSEVPLLPRDVIRSVNNRRDARRCRHSEKRCARSHLARR